MAKVFMERDHGPFTVRTVNHWAATPGHGQRRAFLHRGRFPVYQERRDRLRLPHELAETNKAAIKSLAKGNEHFPKEIAKVEMLGAGPVTLPATLRH